MVNKKKVVFKYENKLKMKKKKTYVIYIYILFFEIGYLVIFC